MAINITKATSTHCTTKCNRVPKYIALHYTAGTSSKSGVAKNTAHFFATSASASADFIVDDGTIVQYNPDPTKYYCWAVGGGKNKVKTTSAANTYNGICKNSNSVSIEICSSKVNKKAPLKASDRDWYFTKEALNNALALTKYLMETYNIPVQNVITHSHVTGKLCPAMWSWDEKALIDGYVDFMNHLKAGTNYSNTVIPKVTNTSTNTNTNTTTKPTTTTTSSAIDYKNLKFNGVDMKLVYDATFYYNNQPDVRAAFGTNQQKLFEHYCNCGINEGRQAIATYNPVVYRKNSPDLEKLYGNNWIKYTQHYILGGYKETNRKAY